MLQHSVLDPSLFSTLHRALRKELPLVPEEIALAQLHRVLDVGCGLHDWGKDLFRTMSEQAGNELVADVRIDGIDLDAATVERANQSIRAGRGQVRAFVADLFALPADLYGPYDLIHVRCLSPYVTSERWQALLPALVRLLAPGGWLVWTEPHRPTPCAHTPAWNQWLSWCEQALLRLGGSLLNEEERIGLLEQAGPWQRRARQASTVWVDAGPARLGYMRDAEVLPWRQHLLALRPVLLSAAVASPDEADRLIKGVLREAGHRQIQSVWPWLTLSGRTGGKERRTHTHR